jgi:hypothetical protein
VGLAPGTRLGVYEITALTTSTLMEGEELTVDGTRGVVTGSSLSAAG